MNGRSPLSRVRRSSKLSQKGSLRPTWRGVLRQCGFKVGQPKNLRDLILFMRACGCVAEQRSADEAEVLVLDARTDRDARTEVSVHVGTWRIKSGASAELVA